ncbi:MAG: RIP metalloprotease RseP, partial [Bryobacteraceae bacterium]
MQGVHGFVVDAIAFIVLIGVMVVVHEFGHFAVAKLCGVRVESFSVGFGPRLFGIKKGDTDYKVCLLPLGGYVKMTGETQDQIQTGDKPATAGFGQYDPGSFVSHPRWQRMLIGAAGPVANFILAFVLMALYFAAINEKLLHEVKETSVEWVVAGSTSAQAGFQPGDVIESFAGERNPDWERVLEKANLNLGQTVPVTVERHGRLVNLSLPLPAVAKGHDFDPTDLGLLPQFVRGPIGVHDVKAGTPAAGAGLRAGDAIQLVDGHEFHTVESLLAYMQSGQGAPMQLTILRDGTTFEAVARPAKLDNGWKLGFSPVPPPMQSDPM